MPTLFETITEKLPKATDEQKRQLELADPAVVEASSPDDIPLKDLVLRWQKNPTEADTAYLLKKMKPTINSAMTSYAPGHQKDLAVKAANLTLTALKSFNPDYGADPSTFVFHNLKRLNRFANRRANIIPISEQASQEYRFLNEVRNEFVDTFDREPSDEELADRTGYSIKKVNKILNSNRVRSETSTLNPETNNSTVYDSDVSEKDFFEYVYRSVGPIDQKIMEWSTGAHGELEMSNKEIAAKLHITPAAVSQRRAKILAKLEEVRSLV